MASKKQIEELVAEQAETTLSEPAEADLTSEQPVVEAEPAPIEDVASESVSQIRAEAGDSWLTIAERHAPAGVKARDYAIKLMEANGNMPISAGVKVVIVR